MLCRVFAEATRLALHQRPRVDLPRWERAILQTWKRWLGRNSGFPFPGSEASRRFESGQLRPFFEKNQAQRLLTLAVFCAIPFPVNV